MVEGAKILVVEDEQEIRRFLRASLADHGYRLIETETGRNGLMQAASQQPDLMILDLGLPDIDGLDVIRELREWSQMPIIVLSARGRETEKVGALDAGADDYLTKPFSVGELLARMRVALRHAAPQPGDAGQAVFTLDGLSVDFDRRQVFVADEEVHLTPIEYRLLTALVRHAGKVITHRQLLKEVWGPDSVFETHYLRVYMAHLRRKIEPDPAQPRVSVDRAGHWLPSGVALNGSRGPRAPAPRRLVAAAAAKNRLLLMDSRTARPVRWCGCPVSAAPRCWPGCAVRPGGGSRFRFWSWLLFQEPFSCRSFYLIFRPPPWF